MHNLARTTTEWAVACLYYREPWNDLLVKSIKPFVNTLSQTNIVERYFFERSYEGTPHLRIYMRGNTEWLKNLVLPNLEEQFQNFIAERPSSTDNLPFLAIPFDTMSVINYEYNKENFGGDIGLPIAERYFHASSEAILSFMKERLSDWSLEGVVSTGMEMHLGFIDAMQLTPKDAAMFFEFCLMNQSDTAFSVTVFEEFYRLHKTPLLRFAKSLWLALKSGELFDSAPYNKWLENCHFTFQDFKKTFSQRVLDVPPRFSTLWAIYNQLLETTNNRLGLTHKNSALLYYILMRCMESMEEYETI